MGFKILYLWAPSKTWEKAQNPEIKKQKETKPKFYLFKDEYIYIYIYTYVRYVKLTQVCALLKSEVSRPLQSLKKPPHGPKFSSLLKGPFTPVHTRGRQCPWQS